MLLKEKIDNLLDAILMKMEYQPRLEGSRKEVFELRERFNSPFTVGVVGLINSGKSTLINGIIGEELLITNHKETTYIVTKLYYSQEPRIIIHFRDGSSSRISPDELGFWTSRIKGRDNSRLEEVVKVDMGYPVDFLKKIEIIDTPGLGPIYGVDANHIKEMLGDVSDQDVFKSSKLTREAMAKADAIIYAFNSKKGEHNLGIIKGLLQNPGKNGNLSNAIGVFTKCDTFWKDVEDDPIGIARESCIDFLMKMNEVRGGLFSLIPNVALPVQGVNHLNEAQYNLFKRLATLNKEDLFKLCAGNKSFCSDHIDDTVATQEERMKLYQAYGGYGVYLVTNIVREGHEINRVKELVLEQSGIEKVQRVVLGHFGNRGGLIKAQVVLTKLMGISQDIKIELMNLDYSENMIADYLYRASEEMLTQENCFKQLIMLKTYFNNNIELSEEDEQDLLHIAGEYGYNCEVRLGVKAGLKSINELKDIAYKKMEKWRYKSDAPLVDRNVQLLASELKHSYEAIYYYLEKLSDY